MNLQTYDLAGRIFHAFQCVDGVLIEPRLPSGFGETANQKRKPSHLLFWDVPYVQLTFSTEPQWLLAWPSGCRYTVRCLDGGAWDRPTNWGSFATLAEALACAKAGPTWRN